MPGPLGMVVMSTQEQFDDVLRKRERQQHVVAEFGQQALRGANLQAVREEAVRLVADTLHVPFVSILELCPDGRLQRTALVGWDASWIGTFHEGSLAAYTVHLDGAVLLDDVAAETRFEIPAFVGEHGIRSGASVVIPGEHGPHGVFGAHAREVRAFSEDDASFLRAMANIVGAVIERERAEEVQRAAHDRIERLAAQNDAIVRQTAESVVIADAGGLVTFANDAARCMLGGDPTGASLVGFARTFNAFDLESGAQVDAEQTALGRAVLFGETVLNARRRIVRPDGREIVAVVNAVPLIAEDGTRLGAVATYRDVTAEFRSAQQKSDFLSAAAHDLKGPLTAIKGHAQLLLRRARREAMIPSERVRADAERIESTATRMSNLITEMLDMTRMELGGSLDLIRRPVDLVALVRDAAAECARGEAASRVQIDAAVGSVVGQWDELRLRRVINNLISNALKYSADDVQVTVRARTPLAEVEVRDRGIGIPAVDRERIFERFFRASNVPPETEGTGIGLTGVRYIVEQHGGSIDVESEEHVGTVVRIRLPGLEDAELRG
jgi:PAS domain S-box-containing protein